jgi:hypothetical protein
MIVSNHLLKQGETLMQSEAIDLNTVRTYTDGRLQLFVGLCEKIGLPQIINKHMQKAN